MEAIIGLTIGILIGAAVGATAAWLLQRPSVEVAKNQLAASERDNKQLQQAVAEWQQQAFKSGQEVAASREQLNSVNLNLESVNNAKSKLLEDIDELKDTANSEQMTSTELQARLDAANDRLDEAKHDISELEEKNKKLETEKDRECSHRL